MNIGIVTTWFERGAAMVSRAYLETLSDEHSVFIYARGGEEQAIGDPHWDAPYVTWAKIPRYPQLGPIEWSDLRAWVSDRALDVIIFNEERQWDVILKARKLGPLIGAYVDYYTHETVPFFQLCDFLLCNTSRHYSVFGEHPQALYIPWGTDCGLFQPQERPEDQDGVVFFHSAGMGGVNLRKGTDILVRAFQNVTGAARLAIHSQVPVERYGPVTEIIRADTRIEFIEATVGAPGLYHRGDVYVYPTRLEGIGLSVPEALACGLPVITTDCAPMNEFVQDGRTGVLVDVERYQEREDGYYWPESICSEDALVEAMQTYVDDPDLAAAHAAAARAYALQHLDWRKNSDELGTQLRSLGRHSPRRSLVRRVRRYERVRASPHAMGLAFTAHGHQDSALVRRYLPVGVWNDPTWLQNRGVWSIAAQALVGYRVSSALRKMAGRLCLPSL
jgi:glycosyltransferase involved in cell wall biosynthesis